MTVIYCTTKTVEQASLIVDQLRASGFSNNDISVLLPDKRGTKDFGHEHNTKAPEGATAGGAAGLGIGAALGWLAGIGALAIPGLGPFIAAGPIMAALGGAAIGGTAGGLAGALVGMGIPEFEAKRYDEKIRGGNVLISVHTDNGDRSKAAKEIFKNGGADNISSASEGSAKSAA